MTKKQVETAIRKIETRYEIGKKILRACGPTSQPGEIAALAKQYGVNRDIAQKLRAMAAPGTGYTKTELNRLFKQFREADWSLTATHFIKLISVPKGKLRDELTNLAIEHHWSSHQLQAEILARQGRRQIGGRKPNIVTGDQFENELAKVLFSWDRWLVYHLNANDDLRSGLQKELKSLHRKIGRLLKSLDES